MEADDYGGVTSVYSVTGGPPLGMIICRAHTRQVVTPAGQAREVSAMSKTVALWVFIIAGFSMVLLAAVAVSGY